MIQEVSQMEFGAMDLSHAVACPEGWENRRLRFLARINKPVRVDIPPETEVSFVPMAAIGENGGIQLDQVKPLDEIGNGYTPFIDGDVVVAKITPCFENGKGALAEGLQNGVAFGTTELHVIQAGELIDQRFLFYLSISELFRQLGEGAMYGAGGQKRVPDRFIKDFRAPVPPLHIQKKIAELLDRKTAEIDTLIVKKHRLVGLLAEKRTALITRAVTKGLNPDAPMKDSGIEWLGEIPVHWEVAQIRRVLKKVEQGWSPACEDRSVVEGEWGVLKSGCVNGGKYDEAKHKALPSGLEARRCLLVKPGDILMCRASGSTHLIGSVAQVRETKHQLMFSDKTYRLTIEDQSMHSGFFVRSMASKYMREQILLSISGAEGLANNIPQSAMKSYLICIPPIAEQLQIMERLEKEEVWIAGVEEKINLAIERLQEYRSALITNAVTGQIQVA